MYDSKLENLQADFQIPREQQQNTPLQHTFERIIVYPGDDIPLTALFGLLKKLV